MALQRQVFNLLRRHAAQAFLTVKPTEVRSMKRWVAPTLREIQRRKDKAGEQPVKPRSSYLEWNFDAEIFAFSKRLGEEFNLDLLKTALTNKSHINHLEMTMDAPPRLTPNTELIMKGDEIISHYVKVYLKEKYPNDIVKAVSDYLTNDKMLAFIGRHVGLTDLILSSDYPPEDETVSNTFKAVVGALEESTELNRAELFVKDFVLTQLNGKDIFDIWEPQEPYQYLSELMSEKDMEPRLCNQSAANTILANYQVGIYSDKKLLGIGWGESVEIAKNTAALNAIQKILKIESSRV